MYSLWFSKIADDAHFDKLMKIVYNGANMTGGRGK
jgi:hypothetical protein